VGAAASSVAFLTIFPVPRRWSSQVSARTVIFFPLVGALVGGLVATGDLVFQAFPMLVRSILVVGLWLLITGGLHIDGWIDACDAMAPGLTPDKALAAMRDPRAGAMGVAGAVVLLGTKWAALASLVDGRATWILLAAITARWMVALVMVALPYGGGPRSVGWAMSRELRWGHAALATALMAGCLLFAGAPALAGAIAMAVVAAVLVALPLRRRLGFVSGDIYGATVELSEVSILLLGCTGVHL